MAIKTRKLMADFETTTIPDDVRVWAVGVWDVEKDSCAFISNNIDDFFEWLANKNCKCWFHNLKFDGEFILSWLLLHGFQYSNIPTDKTFSTLITDDGLFYSITVIFEKQNKKYKKVVFYDSLKKLPFKVSVIAKAFELKDQKLKIDYDKPRPVGYKLDEHEEHYLMNDCKIVSQALKIQMEKGLTKMTNASDAMHSFKSLMGGDEAFRKVFPALPLILDDDLRRAYKGGFTYLNPKHRNRRGLQGITLDVNSLYPWAMYNCLLPYGYPMYFEGEYQEDKNYPLYIIRVRCEFRIKPNHIPCIQLKKNRAFIETEYLSSSNGEIVEMTLTNVDLQLLLDHYDTFNLEYVNGWKFKGAIGLFKEYIDYWMNIKETTTGAMRQLAKLMLNSLYGKFATSPIRRQKIPFLDPDEIVRYKLDEPEETEPVYTAMGAFITAYARNKTIRSAQEVFDRFIYADTDSLHLIGYDMPELDIHPTKLGAWKDEGHFTDSKYIRAKTYMETMRKVEKTDNLKNYVRLMCAASTAWIMRESDGIHYGHTQVTCAGMPDNVKETVTYDNFCPGSTFDGKLMPKRFKGGIVLMPTTFTIK